MSEMAATGEARKMKNKDRTTRRTLDCPDLFACHHDSRTAESHGEVKPETASEAGGRRS